MKAQLLCTCGAGLVLLVANPGAMAQKNVKVYDMGSTNFTGDQIRGPRTVRADNLNVLRYTYKFSNTITFSQAVDLWAQLQSAAVPSAAPPPPQPVQQAAQATKKEFAPPSGTTPKLGAAAQALVDQAEKVIADANAALAGANSAISSASGAGTVRTDCLAAIPVGLDVTKETNRQSDCLATYISAETSAVVQVKSAGQSMVGLLQRSGPPPALLIGYVDQALSSDSIFVQGISAKWPGFDATETLRRSAAGWTIELAARKAKFNGDVPNVSGPLSSSKKDLSGIQETLDAAAKQSTGNDQAALIAEAGAVAALAGRVSEEVNQFSKTSNLLDWAIGENQRVLAVIPDLQQASPKFSDFQVAQEALLTWQTRMTDLRKHWTDYQAGLKSGKNEDENPNPFALATSADCEFAFSRTKTTSVVLTRVDLMPGATATAPETVLSLSVECTSPFTVSAGVAFSTIGRRQFAIQAIPATPPATGTVNTFVATENSSFHPLPIGMISARLYEISDKIAFHASFGMAGNFQSQSAGGSNAEFLIGPSISLFRTMFLTPGLHIGTKSNIGSGFSLGEVVPSSITAVPLQTSYTTGFGFAITFTKP